VLYISAIQQKKTNELMKQFWDKVRVTREQGPCVDFHAPPALVRSILK
jgi:hypothetical protein